jgi:hypothetical protein
MMMCLCLGAQDGKFEFTQEDSLEDDDTVRCIALTSLVGFCFPVLLVFDISLVRALAVSAAVACADAVRCCVSRCVRLHGADLARAVVARLQWTDAVIDTVANKIYFQCSDVDPYSVLCLLLSLSRSAAAFSVSDTLVCVVFWRMCLCGMRVRGVLSLTHSRHACAVWSLPLRAF